MLPAARSAAQPLDSCTAAATQEQCREHRQASRQLGVCVGMRATSVAKGPSTQWQGAADATATAPCAPRMAEQVARQVCHRAEQLRVKACHCVPAAAAGATWPHAAAGSCCWLPRLPAAARQQGAGQATRCNCVEVLRNEATHKRCVHSQGAKGRHTQAQPALSTGCNPTNSPSH
jgi:hypothetical protein